GWRRGWLESNCAPSGPGPPGASETIARLRPSSRRLASRHHQRHLRRVSHHHALGIHGGVVAHGEGPDEHLPWLTAPWLRSTPSQKNCSTRIRLWVRVPVLSEQMYVTEPRASTAGGRRVSACLATIFLAPRARAIATTAG